MEMIHRTTRKCISDWVVHALHMADVASELGDIIEMSNLTWSVFVGIGGACECERFVIGMHIELATFDKVAEVLDGEVHCQELAIKCAVAGFRRPELSREVGNWLPAVINPLLQDGSNCSIGSISHDACWGMRFRVGKQCSID